MKATIKSLILTAAVILLSASFVEAANTNQQNQTENPEQLQVETPDQTTDSTGRTREEVQQETQNQGENVQIQTQESVQEETRTTTQTENGRAGQAGEMMSDVAKKAEELIAQGEQFEGGIGEEISLLAQRQKESANRAQENLNKAAERGGWRKFLLGPDRDSIEKLEIIKQQNTKRAQQFHEISGEVEDAAIRTNIQDTIQNIQDANDVLGQRIQELDHGFSLFGWAVKLLSPWL